MNLAQLVDPEWVQRGAIARALQAPAQHVPVAPRVRVHEAAPPSRPGPGRWAAHHSGGLMRKVLGALAEVEATRTGLTSIALIQATGEPAPRVHSTLGTAAMAGRVRKLSGRRPWRYEITETGKRYLESKR